MCGVSYEATLSLTPFFQSPLQTSSYTFSHDIGGQGLCLGPKGSAAW